MEKHLGQEWLSEFAPVNVWSGGAFQKRALDGFPFLITELWSAVDDAAALHLIQIADDLSGSTNVYHSVDEIRYGEYPPGVRIIKEDESDEYQQHYSRLTRWGRFYVGGRWARTVTWHRHDGSGREAGTVEFWASW